MLGKLLKHEFKATARLLLPIYLVLFVLTIVDRIALSIDFRGALNVIPGFATMAYVISIVTIAVVSLVIIVLRFYKNLMTDEGYLMFTLPVKPSQLINSKLLVSMFWNLVSFLLIIASLLGVFLTRERFGLLKDGIRMVLNEMGKEFGTFNMTLLTIEFIVLVIIALINNILIIYASIAVGQLFNGHKVLGSFAAYIGISTVLQIVVTVALITLGALFHKSFEEISALPQIVFPLTIGFTIIANGLFYWGTNFIFNRKLNLE
ncbi:MAG: putative rane protein [Firmicutes bacterium]|nr:putative rane protein [Bacillota bacterium]